MQWADKIECVASRVVRKEKMEIRKHEICSKK
jgi:hypothetical protein